MKFEDHKKIIGEEEGDVSGDYADLARVTNRPGQFNIIALAQRPGVMYFATKLELDVFTPDTFMNDLFNLAVVTWEECLWYVINIPDEYRVEAYRVARETGMRIADGVPHMLSGSGMAVFPVNGPNAYTLENEVGAPTLSRDEEAAVCDEIRRSKTAE